jgi:hypothetical protein
MFSPDVNKAKTHEASEYENSRESVKFLLEAIKLQQKKSRDYQNAKSSVTQADYYPRGLYTIMDTIQAKLLRVTSILETYEAEQKNGLDNSTNFESLEDSFMDIVNYASFAGAWCRGKMEGQNPSTGLLSNKVRYSKTCADAPVLVSNDANARRDLLGINRSPGIERRPARTDCRRQYETVNDDDGWATVVKKEV